ncbi:manganese efflux pump MntP [Alicyclobacillus dauci]|uniref:Manganese efflux pump n=1 Tax=Alicyclobacillus dauci TaxID=1475485 RepID=A0ABY6Z8M2_9BACL|nr:manganese efflux pump [Alicyclobacillus dauci]WAH38883.1 manganese efflux pump [Alicyclobacillus dauci]
MSWLSVFIMASLIGIGSNFDNCGVGIAYGSLKIKFPHWVNHIVNLVGLCMALLGAYGGAISSHYLSAQTASYISCVMLVLIGLYFWYAGYVRHQVSKREHKIRIKRPGWKEGIILGVALSFTNIASGFGATVSNALTVWIAAISIAIWGYLMIWLGNIVGIGILSRFLSKYSSFISGVLLIMVGIHQVVA